MSRSSSKLMPITATWKKVEASWHLVPPLHFTSPIGSCSSYAHPSPQPTFLFTRLVSSCAKSQDMCLRKIYTTANGKECEAQGGKDPACAFSVRHRAVFTYNFAYNDLLASPSNKPFSHLQTVQCDTARLQVWLDIYVVSSRGI